VLASFAETKAVEKRRHLGAVYTSELLAAWAGHVLASMVECKEALVVDPACGDGALLDAVKSHGFPNLAGVDCDARALKEARRRLPLAQFRQADGLAFLADAARHGGTLDAVIANPPWGAKLTLDRATLASMGYRTISGQSDSWDLFVDGILRALKPNAPVVLILPDALFLPEHHIIRSLLARDAHITMLARLGEGFFSGVYRGTVVVAARNGKPKRKATVACARLSPQARREVLAGQVSLASAVQQCMHNVKQARFATDQHHRFDIDSKKGDHERLQTVEKGPFPWDQWLEMGRGIELSKSGRIVRCPNCREARPLPRGKMAACAKCEHQWSPDRSEIESIVRSTSGLRRGWYPLIVGEDVDRHACVVSRSIRTGIAGIRYKSFDAFTRRKLLVRKTGLGIKATVDDSGAATNQVVFHFTCRPSAPAMLLDYLAGVLCSRVMLAWHLKRQGEVEWRSHPYITPSIIRRFPVPLPESESDWAQAAAISAAVKSRAQVARHDSPEDLMVERLVAGMYRLREDDMQWVLSVLDSAQQLEPIRTLRLSSASLVSPLRIRTNTA